MHRSAKLFAILFGTLLLAALAGLWWTHDTGAPRGPAASGPVIDRRLLDNARQLAPFAETPAEQDLMRESIRLADHELDEAFATAMREAAAAKPPTSGPLLQIHTRIAQAKTRIAADQDRIAKLPAANEAQVELAKAQLALDQDELEDAQADLAREGGDEHGRLQRAQAEHEAAQKESAIAKPVPAGPTGTLNEQTRTWIELNGRESGIANARQQVLAHAAALTREHASLEALIAKKPVPAAAAAADSADEDEEVEEEDPAVMLARLRGLSDQRKSLTELDRRIQDSQQLAEVYKTWGGLIHGRNRDVLRLLLSSLSLIFGVMLVAVFAETASHRAFRDAKDRRRGHQHRFLVSLGIRLCALVVILLIIFGTPSQTPTIIGLATAGLTVVLKDFVMAFIGWFVLMGRNGVRVGDWLEINGVGGEVIEIGMFKTVLLEMGNWSNTGHPTGRRISFMNGYAIEGRWFNFSTTGQWLWDELQVTIPPGVDPYGTAQRIRDVVERVTEADGQQAAQEWERITKQYGTREFSAKPAVDLRPGSNGLEVQVRYITRGPQRYEVKSKLFREIVELLAKS
jgi:small-conductance mechanosensitive channel